ncbi:MAG: hypothetical protein GXP45_03875 [bacterium]|nr:hypothetical protein [bacterium]
MIVVLSYGLLLLVLLKVHHIMTKIQRQRVQKCIYEYDRIWYMIAKAMYNFNEDMKAQGKTSKLVHGTRSILSLKDKDYLHNRKKIFADVKKLETYL